MESNRTEKLRFQVQNSFKVVECTCIELVDSIYDCTYVKCLERSFKTSSDAQQAQQKRNNKIFSVVQNFRVQRQAKDYEITYWNP